MKHQAPISLNKWTSLAWVLLIIQCCLYIYILHILQLPCAWALPGAGLEVRPCHLDLCCGEGRFALDAVNVHDGLDWFQVMAVLFLRISGGVWFFMIYQLVWFQTMHIWYVIYDSKSHQLKKPIRSSETCMCGHSQHLTQPKRCRHEVFWFHESTSCSICHDIWLQQYLLHLSHLLDIS